MYGWDIVEGRDYTIPMGRPESETSPIMKTVGLMLRQIRALWSTGKAVIMDRGSCVLKLLLEISKRVIYGSELIKNMRYWPRRVHGFGINDYFRS